MIDLDDDNVNANMNISSGRGSELDLIYKLIWYDQVGLISNKKYD